MSGRLRPNWPKRDPDGGSGLTRTRGSAAPPGLLAVTIPLKISSLCCSATEPAVRSIGGSGNEAGPAGGESVCGGVKAKARESCRDALPVRFWRSCFAGRPANCAPGSVRRKAAAGGRKATLGCKAGGAGRVVATAGSATTTGGLLGPPMARTDSATAAPGGSSSRRKFTSLLLGQYTIVPSANCLASSSNRCSACPSLIHSTALAPGCDGRRFQDSRRLFSALVTFNASGRAGLAGIEAGLRPRIAMEAATPTTSTAQAASQTGRLTIQALPSGLRDGTAGTDFGGTREVGAVTRGVSRVAAVVRGVSGTATVTRRVSRTAAVMLGRGSGNCA